MSLGNTISNRVYFDESGNTGQDLVNLQDPVFVLGSCRFNTDDEARLLGHFKRYRGNELKFSKLRTSGTGMRAVIDFLNDPALPGETVAVYLIHKPHMIVTKYCDMVLEPSMREYGINFYECGMNIALANLLALSMPVHLNPITWNHFLKLFVQVARNRIVESLDEFRAAARMVHTYLESVDPDIATFIGCAITLRADEFLPVIGETELDPIVPAFYVLADHWGKKTGEWFEIRSDESETLALERERLMALANPEIEPVIQGYDRRKMEFPLKVTGIAPVDSKTEIQVQFADVIAGAVAAAMKAKLQKPSGDFESKCLDACLDRGIFIDGIWPSKDIDPKDLGTDMPPQPGEEDLAAFTARIFHESTEP